jgi:hypothetical protein
VYAGMPPLPTMYIHTRTHSTQTLRPRDNRYMDKQLDTDMNFVSGRYTRGRLVSTTRWDHCYKDWALGNDLWFS